MASKINNNVTTWQLRQNGHSKTYRDVRDKHSTGEMEERRAATAYRGRWRRQTVTGHYHDRRRELASGIPRSKLGACGDVETSDAGTRRASFLTSRIRRAFLPPPGASCFSPPPLTLCRLMYSGSKASYMAKAARVSVKWAAWRCHRLGLVRRHTSRKTYRSCLLLFHISTMRWQRGDERDIAANHL